MSNDDKPAPKPQLIVVRETKKQSKSSKRARGPSADEARMILRFRLKDLMHCALDRHELMRDRDDELRFSTRFTSPSRPRPAPASQS